MVGRGQGQPPSYKCMVMAASTITLHYQEVCKELVFAKLRSPHKAKNGIQLFGKCNMDMLTSHITETSGVGKNVHIIVLSPDGTPLI